MHLEFLPLAQAFLERVRPLLLAREAENNLMIGVAEELAQRPSPATPGSSTSPPRFWLLLDGDRVTGAALMTPPHRIVLTRMVAATAEFLATELHQAGIAVPGVVAPSEAARAFGERWCALAGRELQVGHTLRICEVERVIAAPAVPGRLTTATLADLDLVLAWRTVFSRDVGVSPAEPDEVRRIVAAGRVVLWRTNGPVAMAGAAGPTPHGIRVNMVYTPPEHRRRGYATALVAAFSQQLLDGGRDFCFLFTDLANPTANSIYQKIGYRPVCDFAEYEFVETA